MVAIECSKHGAAYIQVHDNADIAIDFDQLARAEGISHAEKHAGEKVLGDVAKGEANDDAEERRCRPEQ